MDARPENRRKRRQTPALCAFAYLLVRAAMLPGAIFGAASCQNSETIGYWNKPDTGDTTTDTGSAVDDTTPTGTAEETDSETATASGTDDTATASETESESESASASASETESESESASDTATESETESATTDTEDTNTADTNESTDSGSTDSDTGVDTTPAYDRVLFSPGVTVSPEEPLLVEPENNSLGLPGGWFPMPPGMETWSLGYFNSEAEFCVRGEVAQWSGNPFGKINGGIGVGFCFDPDQDFTTYSIDDCIYPTPYEGEFDFVGVSFGIEWTSVPDDLQIAVVWPDFAYVFTYEIETEADGATDYLFSELPGYSDYWSLNDIWTVQIQVDSSITHAIEYDFCIKDFALLVTWK